MDAEVEEDATAALRSANAGHPEVEPAGRSVFRSSAAQQLMSSEEKSTTISPILASLAASNQQSTSANVTPTLSSSAPNSTSSSGSSGFRLNPSSPTFQPGSSWGRSIDSSSASEEKDSDDHHKDDDGKDDETEALPVDDKEREKRNTREEKMLKQVEYYLSDENLIDDEYLQFAMASTPEDWIKLNTLCSFNRMKKLKANVKRLGELCATSATIQVLESKKAIRRSTPLPEELVRRRQTVWFQMLPDGFIEEKLSSRLTQFGQIEEIKIFQASAVLSTPESHLTPHNDDSSSSVCPSPAVLPLSQSSSSGSKLSASSPAFVALSPSTTAASHKLNRAAAAVAAAAAVGSPMIKPFSLDGSLSASSSAPASSLPPLPPSHHQPAPAASPALSASSSSADSSHPLGADQLSLSSDSHLSMSPASTAGVLNPLASPLLGPSSAALASAASAGRVVTQAYVRFATLTQAMNCLDAIEDAAIHMTSPSASSSSDLAELLPARIRCVSFISIQREKAAKERRRVALKHAAQAQAQADREAARKAAATSANSSASASSSTEKSNQKGHHGTPQHQSSHANLDEHASTPSQPRVGTPKVTPLNHSSSSKGGDKEKEGSASKDSSRRRSTSSANPSSSPSLGPSKPPASSNSSHSSSGVATSPSLGPTKQGPANSSNGALGRWGQARLASSSPTLGPAASPSIRSSNDAGAAPALGASFALSSPALSSSSSSSSPSSSTLASASPAPRVRSWSSAHSPALTPLSSPLLRQQRAGAVASNASGGVVKQAKGPDGSGAGFAAGRGRGSSVNNTPVLGPQ